MCAPDRKGPGTFVIALFGASHIHKRQRFNHSLPAGDTCR